MAFNTLLTAHGRNKFPTNYLEIGTLQGKRRHRRKHRIKLSLTFPQPRFMVKRGRQGVLFTTFHSIIKWTHILHAAQSFQSAYQSSPENGEHYGEDDELGLYT